MSTPLIGLPQLKNTTPDSWLIAATGLATMVPALLAYNISPSATLLNQAAALLGWGAVTALTVVALRTSSAQLNAGLICLLAALCVLMAAALISPLWTRQPLGLAVSNAGMLASSITVALCGAAAQRVAETRRLFGALCWAMLVTGVLSVAVGVVQIFFPDWADGELIAQSSAAGRAVGNLRQSNHLSTLLLWSAVAALWLAEMKALQRAVAMALFGLMIFGVVMSASRTGIVGTVLLAMWGLLDRRLAPHSRQLLVSSPVLYAIGWVALAAWAHSVQQVFGGEARLVSEGALATTRYAIWSNTLELICRHPWAGVGFGEFNFAWTLTPFPKRPIEFFDHAHNLPLQLAVELGLPLAIAVIVLLGVALWCAFIGSRRSVGLEATTLRAAFMMVLMMALHSQLEYPLWYAYFLLPTALVFGLCLGRPPGVAAISVRTPPGRTRPLLIAGLLVIAGGFAMVLDYMRVVAIFEPPENAAPLAERIAHGQRSWFFAHHADYAAATVAEHPSEVMDAFKRAPHYLLDARLMIAWANALHERGDTERARYIAQRLREFGHHPLAKEFFAPCGARSPATQPEPYQCVPPSTKFDYRDFR
jgi:O-antigen ligase